MVNIRQSDIAKKLKVSRITISKALRDHPDISAAMKKKVLAAAKKMGYFPNMIATQLNSGKTSTIGIVVPDLENSFFSYIVDSMIDYATENGFRTILTVSREKEKVELQNIENLIGMRVDGLLVCNSQETRDNKIYSQIKKMKIPLVFFDRVVAEHGFPSVVFDDYNGAVKALDAIIESGITKIACFSGYQSLSIGKERLKGYLESLRKHRIKIRKKWIIKGGYELLDGQSSFKKLLELGDLPELIYAVNDRVALGAYMAASDSGVKIPDSIGIVGFGFCETTDLFNPPLAVINQDPRKMGYLATQKLINDINAGKREKAHKIRIDEEFFWKESLKKKVENVE